MSQTINLILGVFLFSGIWIYTRVHSITDYYITMMCFIIFGMTIWNLSRELYKNEN
tara:strand:- start:258 stop:425 length:168 start_codon:yes stop_codon:yes gene_type:complete